MGVAAQHRGNAVIRQQVCRELDVRQSREESRRAIQVAEDCNAFVRQAMDYLAEPRGLRQKTVENSRTRRGWARRHAALVAAHNTWVDVDSRNAFAFHGASVRRAKAAFELLIFALGCWTIPDHIQVPRAARGKCS